MRPVKSFAGNVAQKKRGRWTRISRHLLFENLFSKAVHEMHSPSGFGRQLRSEWSEGVGLGRVNAGAEMAGKQKEAGW